MNEARGLRCVYCDARYSLDPMFEGCPACATDNFASGLTPSYDYGSLLRSLQESPLAGNGEGIWRFRRLLPIVDPTSEISLGEGSTPLISMPKLASELGVGEIWIKDESANPTWSFKDRNAAVTVSKALEARAKTLVTSTSGNHGAALAAYAARSGLRCVALTYPGVSAGNRILMQALGAEVIVTTPEGRLSMMRDAVHELGWYPANNFTALPTNSAYGHEGYKTIAYEIAEQLDSRTPDLVAVPAAYGEGLFGIWKGFDELTKLDRASTVPRMLACEPNGGPLGAARDGHAESIAVVPSRPTVARGIGGTANSYIGVAALSASSGSVVQALDNEILRAQRDLAGSGVFAEPASATALACLRRAAECGELRNADSIVLVNTSSGLKNLEAIETLYPEPQSVPPSIGALPTRSRGKEPA